MDRIDRIKRLHELLTTRRTPLAMSALCEELDCGERTVHRVLAELRDRFGMPIEHVDGRGYRLDQHVAGSPHRLPDLWFTAEELEALLVLQRHLDSVGQGLLAERLAPVQRRIERVLGDSRPGLAGLAERVRFVAVGERRAAPRHFAAVADALVRRRVLQVTYHSRSDDRISERGVHPQRLVHYRDNWYLDAWCERSGDLRIFSLDRILALEIGEASARDLSAAELDRHLAAGYGIFAGEPEDVAVVRFTPHAARWAAAGQWHDEQAVRWLDDGRFELRVPYSRPEELLRDVLAYGPDAEIVAPAALREQARRLAGALAAVYGAAEAAGV